MVVIFNLQNSQLLTLSLPTEEIFQVRSQKRPVANFPVDDFRSFFARNAIIKVIRYVTFRFCFRILVFLLSYESFNVAVYKR